MSSAKERKLTPPPPPLRLQLPYRDPFRGVPDDFFDHDAYNPELQNIEDFSVVRRIGQGKFGIVFDGYSAVRHQRVIVKLLKPVRRCKIHREIKILKILQSGDGHENIVNLEGVVQVPHTGQYALIFGAETNFHDFKDVYQTWNDENIRYYSFEVLRALEYCHSHGIIHRDIKPHNLLVNLTERRIQLIDFGLAEFYRPGERYNVRVASRHYKPPELLVEYPFYDYSLDMWSFACILAAMLFRREPFFNGQSNDDQLVCIAHVLGTGKLLEYVEKYGVQLERMNCDFFRVEKRPRRWQEFVHTENEHLVGAEAFDLLRRLLRYDHAHRWTAKETMDHCYYHKLKK